MEKRETDKIQLKVTLSGRKYPLQINATDETDMRKIVKEINDKVNKFQISYPDKDKQDCLSMVALEYAVNFHKSLKISISENLSKKLSKIDELLDSVMV